VTFVNIPKSIIENKMSTGRGLPKVPKRRHNVFRRKGFSDNKGNKYYHQTILRYWKH
jgi:hypothetical protein